MSNINKHLALDSILVDCQLGLRSRRSCETQLVHFVPDIISNLDSHLGPSINGLVTDEKKQSYVVEALF